MKTDNHGYGPQSKLWKQFRSKLLGIIPSAVRDCSTYKFQCTSFLKFESHNKLREWATPMTIGAFILTAFTGIMLFFKVEPGSAKLVHEWFSWLLVIGTILHLIANWRASVRYLSKSPGKVILISFLLLTCISFIPLHVEGHNSGHPLKRISDTLIQAPLLDVAQVANHTPEEAADMLKSKGIIIDSRDQTIREIATKNRTSPQVVLNAIF